MSAEIKILKNGEASFVECTHHGEIRPAWHGLGEAFDNPMTIEFAMEKSHSNFVVNKQPVAGLTPEIVEMIRRGEPIDASLLNSCIINGSTCNMRMDTEEVFAVTSDKYGVVQNADAFRFINNICGVSDDAPVIDTMGVLSDGTTFASIRMKSLYDLGKNDEVDMYIIVKNSFNNKEALSVFTAYQRVVCQNTLNAAFKGAESKLFIRHTKNANNRLNDFEDAARTLGFYQKYREAFIENMERLKTIKLSDKECEKIICKTLMGNEMFNFYADSGYNLNCDDLGTRTKNTIAKAIEVLHDGVGQKECADKGTGLWLYNGITTLFANHTEYKGQEKKFNSIFGGNADDKQQKVFESILSLAA